MWGAQNFVGGTAYRKRDTQVLSRTKKAVVSVGGPDRLLGTPGPPGPIAGYGPVYHHRMQITTFVRDLILAQLKCSISMRQ